MKLFTSVLAVALSVMSSVALAKSVTVKIEVMGPGLAKPVEITDPEILRQFNIWNGPGVSTSNARSVPAPGAFIDWSQGTTSELVHGEHYTVTFHQSGRPDMHEWHRKYVVTYAYAPEKGAGHIYLPGPGDGDVYRRNTFSIVHGVEGSWFRASAPWEQTVRPLIERRSGAREGAH